MTDNTRKSSLANLDPTLLKCETRRPFNAKEEEPPRILAGSVSDIFPVAGD
jgi:hypothetical protein